MVAKQYSVVWTRRAQQHIKKIFEYINEDSQQNALKVLEDIVSAVNRAIANPGFYAANKYKLKNDGSYRAFEIHHYRIAYRFDNNTIRVLRVRHTALEPKYY